MGYGIYRSGEAEPSHTLQDKTGITFKFALSFWMNLHLRPPDKSNWKLCFTFGSRVPALIKIIIVVLERLPFGFVGNYVVLPSSQKLFFTFGGIENATSKKLKITACIYSPPPLFHFVAFSHDIFTPSKMNPLLKFL